MNAINTLEDALAQELGMLYFGERKLKGGLTRIEQVIQSAKLRDVVSRYTDSCHAKRAKIDRAFACINRKPEFHHTRVLDELIQESVDHVIFAQDPEVIDQVIISCIERIITYKLCAYEASIRYAEAMNLQAAVEPLLTLIEWENETKKEVAGLFTGDFHNTSHLFA